MNRLTATEYREFQESQGHTVLRSSVPVTLAALRRLRRNAADPEKARKRKAPMGRERDVLRAITDYLDIELGPEGRGWFRMNAGMAERGDHRIRLAPEGTSDLLAIIPVGRRPGLNREYALLMWIEVKRPSGRTDKLRAIKQGAFRGYMSAIGCIAIEARSLEDVTAILPPRGRR